MYFFSFVSGGSDTDPTQDRAPQARATTNGKKRARGMFSRRTWGTHPMTLNRTERTSYFWGVPIPRLPWSLSIPSTPHIVICYPFCCHPSFANADTGAQQSNQLHGVKSKPKRPSRQGTDNCGCYHENPPTECDPPPHTHNKTAVIFPPYRGASTRTDSHIKVEFFEGNHTTIFSTSACRFSVTSRNTCRRCPSMSRQHHRMRDSLVVQIRSEDASRRKQLPINKIRHIVRVRRLRQRHGQPFLGPSRQQSSDDHAQPPSPAQIAPAKRQ